MENRIETPLTRREFLKTTGALAVGALTAGYGPYIHAEGKVILRVLGTHVTLQTELRQRAEEELGIKLVFEPRGDAELLERGQNNPDSFDIYEHWSDAINLLWKSKAIQSIDTKRLTYWGEVNNLTKTGKVTADAKIGLGGCAGANHSRSRRWLVGHEGNWQDQLYALRSQCGCVRLQYQSHSQGEGL